MASFLARLNSHHPNIPTLCRDLAAQPTPLAMYEASKECEVLLSALALATTKALSPAASARGRKMMFSYARDALDALLFVLDTLLRIPLAILDTARFRWSACTTAVASLRLLSDNLLCCSASLDRAAFELGFPPYDGGPFAVCGAGGAA